MSKAKTHVYNNRIELTVNGTRYAHHDGDSWLDWIRHDPDGNWSQVHDDNFAAALNELARYRSRSYHV